MSPSVPWRPPLLVRTTSTALLTRRQADVLTGLCHGLTNDQIGRRLGITGDTVKTHLKRLFAAMGARDRCHAAALAMSGQVTVAVEMGHYYARKEAAA